MSNYDFTGKVCHITEKQEFSSGFYKREMILDDGADNYPQQIPFECVKKACDLLDSQGVQKGDTVKVTFDLRGREYNGRWYGSNNAWKIEVVSKGAAQPAAPTPPAFEPGDTLDEDVPF